MLGQESVRRFVAPALVLLGALSFLSAAVPGSGARSTPARAGASSSSHPLRTALSDPSLFPGSEAAVALNHAHDAGATLARLILFWPQVAPGGSRMPAGFDPTNPADPAYNWSKFDKQVTLAVAHGLQPIVSILNAPAWASEAPPSGTPAGGAYEPSPTALADFATAAAKRYSGSFQDLPRVRYWQVWNEPNVSDYLRPQLDGGKPASPDLYRRMVNSFADAVHGVDPTNAVIAGGTSPFAVQSGKLLGLAPLRFMRELLCMGNTKPPRPTCNATVKFDAWAHHPYTSGGPMHHARRRDDVSLGDLPQMRALLSASASAGHVVSRGPVQFWVTEFSWDSKPPDKKGVPAGLEGRWVAEALYRMWLSGVSVVTWFRLNDDPWYVSFEQSGLYFTGRTIARDRPKPAFTAFRFPFVAYPRGSRVFVWGRTPWGKPGAVEVDRQSSVGRRWVKVTILRADRYGIFSHNLSAVKGRWLRARLPGRGARSLPFSLSGAREDLRVNPFGG